MEDEPKTGNRKLVLAGIAAVVAVVLGGLVVLSPSGASDLATVRPLEPTVRLRQPMQSVFKQVTTPVATNQGAAIETDKTGMAEITYFDGSLSRVGPETGYELSTLQDRGGRKAMVGDLDLGRTYHRVEKLSGSQDRFEVRTPNAVAAVRGTRFIVVCLANGECIFGVIDGVIEITSRSTGEMCVVRPGESLIVRPDVTCSEIEALDLNDPWVLLNLRLDGIDVEELRERLFGDDELSGTPDDPAPEDVDGDGDGVSDATAAADAGRGGSGSGSGAGSGGGSGDPGTSPPEQALGGVTERPADPGAPGQGSTTTAQPGQGSTTTAQPGQGSTTTTRPSQGTTTTTRPSQGSTTTTRPPGTTTTRPPGTTSTTRVQGTTSTTCGGYPPTCG